VPIACWAAFSAPDSSRKPIVHGAAADEQAIQRALDRVIALVVQPSKSWDGL
jgi:tagatose-1,6-bisphosphate aldolase non-catalytic subunit AgaZ/GatZ